MNQFSTSVNPSQPITLPRNIIHHTMNYGNCTTVTTRGGGQTVDQPIFSVVEEDIRKEDEVKEANIEVGDAPSEKAELSRKWSPFIVSTTTPTIVSDEIKDGKYRRFITMLK